MNPAPASPASLRLALSRTRRTGVAVVALTLGIGMMPVAGAVYLLMLFDVALASRSIPTIAGMAAMTVGMVALTMMMAAIRGRLLTRIGATLFMAAERPIGRVIAGAPDIAAARRGIAGLADLETIRRFVAGGDAAVFADLAAVVLAVPVLFCLGWPVLSSWLVLAAVMGAMLHRALGQARAALAGHEAAVAETSLDIADPALLRALGLHERAGATRRAAATRLAATAQASGHGANRRHLVAHGLTLVAWIAAIATGCLMAFVDAASVGAIAAGAFVTQTSLAAIAAAIARVDAAAAARSGRDRVDALLATAPAMSPRLPLPAPVQSLSVEALTLIVPDSRRVVLREVGFALEAGDVLAVAGPMAAGKSALLRALVGAWAPTVGKIRLDGGTLDQWDACALAHHIGYLPQGADLFDGTVAQNIARFDPAADPARVLDAAREAGVHDMIVRLPRGYDTLIGSGLSGGERQRIALARALYGKPFLLILDEPAAHADAASHAAIAAAVRGVSARGGIVVAVGHAAMLIEQANMLLILRGGRMENFGPKDDVRRRVAEARAASRTPSPTAELTTAKE